MTGLTSRAVGPRPDRICGRVRTPWRVGASDALCAGSDSTAPVRGPPDRGASHEPQAMIPTPTLLTAMLKRDDADLSYLQQALATVCAQTGGKAGTVLETVLTPVPRQRAVVVRPLAVQVQAERSPGPPDADDPWP